MADDLSSLLSLIPVGDIAEKLGIPESVAEGAVQQVLPGLVSGLQANAASDDGAASLQKALTKHQASSLASSKPSLKDIDEEDGGKIVGHVFGDNQDAVAQALAGNSASGGVTGDIIKKILPIVAPIVLAWLASKFFGGGSKPAAESKQEESSGGLGDILGGLLGGGGGSSSGGGIGDILGGLLGGGSSSKSSGGGLGDILGGLLGGKS